MSRLADLLDLEGLELATQDGHVKQQRHPYLPLSIFNYTERCAYERAWTPTTRTCRGLIVGDDGSVVARPWEKFFNYGEPDSPPLELTATAEVVDKVDGSLGILYPTPGGLAVATRGSFTSEQAIHATAVLRERYAEFRPPDGMTVLVEIVYPGNRIVCDYGDIDDLILLGAVNISTGEAASPLAVTDWIGPRAEIFPASTLGDALSLSPRPGAEGVVVRLDGAMVKIKQEDYVRLHRIVTGLNARVVWERLGAGKTVAEICEPVPDELHGWIKNLAARLTAALGQVLADSQAEHVRIVSELSDGWQRKDYAALASRSPLRAWLFMLLDGKDPAEKVWRTLRPSGDDRPVHVSEDTA